MTHRFLLLLSFLLVQLLPCSAQGRSYIREQITSWGGICRNVTITKTGGDIALNQSNAYAYNSIPSGLASAIKELHDDEEYIDDIQLTEAGRWLILYGDNGFRWSNISSSLEAKLREYNRDQEVVTSVTFNDNNDWIIISQNYFCASTQGVTDYISEGLEQHGKLWAAHLTNDGLVLVYENGYRYLGNVPDKVKEALKKTKLDVYRMKFLSDGTYFFADKEGNCDYWM